MRLTLSLICFAAALSLSAQNSEDAAIREIVKRYVDARDSRDAQATAALFTVDADQLVSSGEWRKGRQEVVQGAMASSQASQGKRTITLESIRLISPTVALADGRYEIGGAAGTRKMWTSFVLARGSDGWRITAIRNMLPAAPAPSK